MSTLLGRVADLFAVLAGVVLLIIVLVTVANTGAFILDRIAGVFGADVAGLPGYEEFVQLAISGAALMFFPYCQANRGHVAVKLFTGRLPRSVEGAIDKVWLTLTAAIALFLVYWMVLGMIEAHEDGAVTAVLGWAVWPFYAPGIAATTLWGLVAATQLLGNLGDA